MSKRIIEKTSWPFWSWNDELDKDKLVAQIHYMKEKGYGGFFMHARSGLTTEYLGKEWFDCVRACCEEAKKLGMQAWAYDENGWPSGFVGGKLLETKEFRLHHLKSSKGEFDEKATYHYIIKNGELLRSDKKEDGTWINVYDCESNSLVDILNDEAVDAFLNETHEKYKKAIPDISNNILGFFTDEPQYRGHVDGVPYPRVMGKYYLEKYGEDVVDGLGLLFSDQKGCEKFRYRYYKACQEIFLKNFAEKVYNWHETNGLKLTGHYIEERSMYTSMLYCAGIVPFYEFMHIPGIDWLTRKFLPVSAIRQLVSVSEQLGKKYVLSETFAMTGWDVTPKELKNIADYQYNYGVNVMCQHLLPYSEKGQRKNDHPTHFTPFTAWYEKGILDFNNYFDALGQFIRDGKENVKVGVLFTIRSAYLKFDVEDWTKMNELDESYVAGACENLANHHVAFHIIDETLLARHGSVEGNNLKLGEGVYDTLVMPEVIVIDKTTDDILRKFVANGGKVLLLGNKPTMVEGEFAELDYLESNVTFEDLCNSNEYNVSSLSKDLHTSLRVVDGKKYVFAVNVSEKETIVTEIESDGKKFNAVYDVVENTETYVGNVFTIPPKSSLIVCVYDGLDSQLKDYEIINIGSGDYSIVDFNANYLPLDFAKVSYDGINFAETLPVIGIVRNLLEERYKGDVYLKYNFTLKEIPKILSVISEDVDKISAIFNGKPIVFDGDCELDEMYSSSNIMDNVILGENELIIKYNFYQDESVYYALFGEGVSESIKNKMAYNTMISSPFLSGDFGVYSDTFRPGTAENIVYADTFTVAKAPEKVVDIIENGFPFFCGNITLKKEFLANSNNVKLKFNGRFHIAEVSVNGNYVDKIMFTDVVDVSSFVKQGENMLEVKLYSGNRNLLGPHHFVHMDVDSSVSPCLFILEGSWVNGYSPDFTERYSFSKFGLFDK